MIVVDPAPVMEAFTEGFGGMLVTFLGGLALSMAIGAMRRLMNA